MIARLAPGRTVRDAQAEIDVHNGAMEKDGVMQRPWPSPASARWSCRSTPIMSRKCGSFAAAVLIGLGALAIRGAGPAPARRRHGARRRRRWVTGQAMQALLYQVPPLHVATLVAAGVLMAVVSLAACLLPSNRAARTSPMEVLAQ